MKLTVVPYTTKSNWLARRGTSMLPAGRTVFLIKDIDNNMYYHYSYIHRTSADNVVKSFNRSISSNSDISFDRNPEETLHTAVIV
jgi:transposase